MRRSGACSEELSRRSLLHGAACAAAAAPLLGATVAAGPAVAQAKQSQAAVAYQLTPKGSQRCDNCALWQPPNACKSVSGVIAPQAWCKIWIPMKR